MRSEQPFVNRLACVINADGTIARGFMIEKCELHGENEYIITWAPIPNLRIRHDQAAENPGSAGPDSRKSRIEAITWKLPLQGEAKTNFSGTIGSSLVEEVQPGLITVGLCKDAHQMKVRTYDASGKPARRPFHIAAFRDV
jgi:hypothetical protein